MKSKYQLLWKIKHILRLFHRINCTDGARICRDLTCLLPKNKSYNDRYAKLVTQDYPPELPWNNVAKVNGRRSAKKLAEADIRRARWTMVHKQKCEDGNVDTVEVASKHVYVHGTACNYVVTLMKILKDCKRGSWRTPGGRENWKRRSRLDSGCAKDGNLRAHWTQPGGV